MPNTSRTTSVYTSRSTTRNTTKSTYTVFNTSKSTTTSYTTTYSTSRGTSRTTTYTTYYNTSRTTTYNTSFAVSTSRQTSNTTSSAFNTTYYTTLSANTTIYTNTNTVVNTPLTTFSVTTIQPSYRSTNFYRPPKVSEANLMLNLDARVSAGSATWKDQSGNSRDATVSGTMGVSDRCVALYNFHSDATDLTGNYTGTETDITYASGNYGQAAVFNGSSSLVELPTSSVAGNILSVSLWFNSTSNDSPIGLFSARGATSPSVRFIITLNRNASGDGTIGLDSGSSTNFIILGTYDGDYNDGNWHHVVASINYTTKDFIVYIDGVSRISGNNSSISTSHSIDKVYLGSNYSSQYLNGKIDQVRIFNKALSSSEVTSLYNENSSTFKKVDIFNDAAAGYYTLDSTDSFYTSQFITDQNFTIGGWFYRTTTGGSAGYEALWTQGYAPSVRATVYGAAGASTGDRLYIYLHNGSTGVSYNTNIDLPTAEWFHLMKTYDMSTGSVKVYLNGALKLTQSTITGNIYSASNSDPYFRIAKNSTNANGYINGRISQVRVYDSILTDEQVLDDYTTHDYLYN